MDCLPPSPRSARRRGTGRGGLSCWRASSASPPAGAQGLVVTKVEQAGPAAEAGLREGDVIEEVNRQPVRSVADLQASLRRTGAGRPALLLVRRGDASLFLTCARAVELRIAKS